MSAAKTHRHRMASCITRCFFGPVRQPENPMAHGGVCEIASCWCGAERRTNINQGHVERGEWYQAQPFDELDVEAQS